MIEGLLTDSATTLVSAAAVITALGIIWVKGVKPVCRKLFRAVNMVQDVTEQLAWMLPFFHSQMVENGGTTFKDWTVRIDTFAKSMTLRFEEFAADMQEKQKTAIRAAEEARLAAIEAVKVGDERHQANIQRLDLIEYTVEDRHQQNTKRLNSIEEKVGQHGHEGE